MLTSNRKQAYLVLLTVSLLVFVVFVHLNHRNDIVETGDGGLVLTFQDLIKGPKYFYPKIEDYVVSLNIFQVFGIKVAC